VKPTGSPDSDLVVIIATPEAWRLKAAFKASEGSWFRSFSSIAYKISSAFSNNRPNRLRPQSSERELGPMPIMRQLDLRGQLLTEAKIDSLLPRSKHDGLSAEQVAVEVIAGVKIGGASYLRKLTQDLDGFDPEPLRVSSKELQSALASCDAALRSAIEMAIERNRLVSQAAMPKPFTIELANGSKVSQRYVPMDSVGLYAPGGKAVYPSSVIMNAVPAQVAKVPRIVLASPGQKQFAGRPHPSVLATAAILGLDEVYCMGGPAAIAAFAYGLDDANLLPVRLVTGPGNAFVAAAKRLVRSDVAIDSEAGTTEIFIIADKGANSKFVAADLISQAEHDEAAAAVLVTDSAELIESVLVELQSQLSDAKHSARISQALTGQQSALVLVDDIEAAVAVSNHYATEHLELLVADPTALLSSITNAGAVFLGEYSPVSVGDYLAGSNHVLPTGGTARYSSGLGVHTFLRTQQVINYAEEGLAQISESLPIFAQAEDLPAHGSAVSKRFEGN
jgi:histidinol dehydrogenase